MMENEIIASYDESDNMETVYECTNCLEMAYEEIEKCDDCGHTKFSEQEREIEWEIMSDYWNDCKYEADIILGKKEYVRVEGTNQRWNGSRSIGQIVPEQDMQSIISTYMGDIDMASCEVYEDRVEFKNCHHDGTNRYTFYPFSLSELTIEELKKLADDVADYNDMGYSKSYSKALKGDLIDYIEQYELYL